LLTPYKKVVKKLEIYLFLEYAFDVKIIFILIRKLSNKIVKKFLSNNYKIKIEVILGLVLIV